VNAREQRGRKRRRIRTGLLVAIAIVLPVGLMAGLTAQAVAARTTCTNHPLQVRVAVSPDIFPAIERVGELFNRQEQAAGQCVQAQVSQEDPAAVAGQVDGQSATSGLPAADAWIPDSSLWVDVAQTYPLGAQRVQATGIDVARSPLMIVMPPSAAAQIPEFNNSVGWSFLLPGGPQSALGVRVEIPDPTQSAAGLATLVEISRLLGNGPDSNTQLTQFVLSAQPSAQFDDPESLTAFVTQAAPPLGARPVTVTSEQAVIAYDAVHPTAPLAAEYPSGTGALATPELDYPYVLTSTNPAEIRAAREFGALLQQSYAASVIRYYGFRSGNGVPGTIPAADGLAQQPLVPATVATRAQAQTVLQAWQHLEVGSRDLAVLDVSSAMKGPSGLPGVTLEQELTESAGLGLALFPDSTQIGLWEFASGLAGSLPYKPLVAVGPLPGELGLISRRQQIQEADLSLRSVPGPATLNQTILAAYKQMVDSYQPGLTNAVIMMTAGVDNARGDLTVPQLVTALRALHNPSKPVELIIVMLGTQGNFRAMQEIAAAGDGEAFGPVTNPAQIDEVFFEGVSRRICQSTGGCPS
jgi:Ca-activated chloride channel homolog